LVKTNSGPARGIQRGIEDQTIKRQHGLTLKKGAAEVRWRSIDGKKRLAKLEVPVQELYDSIPHAGHTHLQGITGVFLPLVVSVAE